MLIPELFFFLLCTPTIYSIIAMHEQSICKNLFTMPVSLCAATNYYRHRPRTVVSLSLAEAYNRQADVCYSCVSPARRLRDPELHVYSVHDVVATWPQPHHGKCHDDDMHGDRYDSRRTGDSPWSMTKRYTCSTVHLHRAVPGCFLCCIFPRKSRYGRPRHRSASRTHKIETLRNQERHFNTELLLLLFFIFILFLLLLIMLLLLMWCGVQYSQQKNRNDARIIAD